MNREEIKKILSAYRPGGEDANDPVLAAARENAQNDPELARWFAEEQAFDQKFAEALAGGPVPFGLETRLLAEARALANRRRNTGWARRIGWALAAVASILVLFSSWRGPFQPNISSADYRLEMVSFIRLAPPLDFESARLEAIQRWLDQAGAPGEVFVPAGLAALDPVGCRVLFFHGHNVTLICFRRSGSRLTHLFVIDREALPGWRAGAAPVYAQEGGWMTAAFEKNDRVYLLAAQGDRALLDHYLEQPGRE